MLLNGLFLFPPLPFSPPALPGRPARLDMLIILGLDALVLLLASRNPESAFLQEAARQMTHARWEGLHLYDLVFPRFRLHFRRFHVLFPGEIHQRERFLRPRASPSLETGSRPGFSGATGQWNAYLTESMRYASVLGLIGFPAPLQEPASCCAAERERLPLRRGSPWPSLPCSSSPAATSRRTAPSTHG